MLRHRLVLSYEALADGTSVEDLITKVVTTVQAPRLAPSQDPVTGEGVGVQNVANPA